MVESYYVTYRPRPHGSESPLRSLSLSGDTLMWALPITSQWAWPERCLAGVGRGYRSRDRSRPIMASGQNAHIFYYLRHWWSPVGLRRYWRAKTGTTSCMTALMRMEAWCRSAPSSASILWCFLFAETVSTVVCFIVANVDYETL